MLLFENWKGDGDVPWVIADPHACAHMNAQSTFLIGVWVGLVFLHSWFSMVDGHTASTGLRRTVTLLSYA